MKRYEVQEGTVVRVESVGGFQSGRDVFHGWRGIARMDGSDREVSYVSSGRRPTEGERVQIKVEVPQP